MRRVLFALVATFGVAESDIALAACNGTTETKLNFSSVEKPDTFVVESFGAHCADARPV